MAESHIGLSCRLFKGVKVHDHHVDGLNAVSGDRSFVVRIAANVEQAAMNEGMQRLHAAVEHFGKAGQLADVFDREPGIAQRARRAAGGNQFNPKAGKNLCKLHQAGFVGHT